MSGEVLQAQWEITKRPFLRPISPSFPLFLLCFLSPSEAGVRIPSQTENMLAIPGPRCQCVAASGLLASVAGSCAGCFWACHVAEPADGGLVTKQSFFENMVSTMVLTRKQCAAQRGPGSLGRALWALALMVLPACSAEPLFHASELAFPANLPSCTVSVAGALRHGAP